LIAVASDHAGYALKTDIIKKLGEMGLECADFGCAAAESCDFVDYAEPACREVAQGRARSAILICGTGIGMSMAANKIKGIRAALCGDSFSARYTRLHNDANVLCLGARVTGAGLALDIVDVFLNTEFEGGKHLKRIEKISALEGLQVSTD
jgi:ribose 5-phosphate isomerase B